MSALPGVPARRDERCFSCWSAERTQWRATLLCSAWLSLLDLALQLHCLLLSGASYECQALCSCGAVRRARVWVCD